MISTEKLMNEIEDLNKTFLRIKEAMDLIPHEKQTNEIQQLCRELDGAISNVTNSKRSIKEELSGLDKQIEELEIGNVALDDEVVRLSKEIEGLPSVEMLQDEIRAREGIIIELSNGYQGLEGKLAQENERHQSEIEKMNKTLKESQKLINKLNDDHKAAREIIDSQMKDLRSQLDIKTNQLSQTKKTLKTCNEYKDQISIQSRRYQQNLEDLKKDVEGRDELERKKKDLKIAGDLAYQFQRYVCKFLFPRWDYLTKRIKFSELDQVVEEYLEEFKGQLSYPAAKEIQDKISSLKLKEIQNCDGTLKRLKESRFGEAHEGLANPKEYPSTTVKDLMKNAGLSNLTDPLQRVLDKLSPDGLIFTDVRKRTFAQ